MRYRNLPHMPGGEYILRRDYSTIPSTLILCRVLARCHHVRDKLDNIRRQALAERWHPLIQGLAECSVSKNDPWTPGKQWPQYDFMAFRWPQWAVDYLDSSGVQCRL